MTIRSILLDIKTIAQENMISEPYIVGGLPRDKAMGQMSNIEDVDVTTGDDSVHKLALLVADKFKTTPVQLEDGHYQLVIDHIKYDFSSNYNSPDVDFFLAKAGINDPTPMQKELFSRDFTCNTLVVPMNFLKIQDYTGMGFKDIKSKVIRCPLPPRITLRDDPRRVIRAIYLAAKLGFTIEKDIIVWALNHHESIKKHVKPGFSKNKLTKAAKKDMTKTIDYIAQMKLGNVVSLPKILLDATFSGETNVK